MQGNRQTYAQLHPTPIHHRHNTGSGKRDAPARKPNAFMIHHDLQRLGDILIIIKRLTHAHDDDIGKMARRAILGAWPFTIGIARGDELANDFRRAQIAHQGLRAGVAKAAGKRATNLR